MEAFSVLLRERVPVDRGLDEWGISGMRELRREIEIEASPQRVWEILTDFPAYAEWNPFIPRVIGEPKVGARLEVRIEPPNGRGMTFRR